MWNVSRARFPLARTLSSCKADEWSLLRRARLLLGKLAEVGDQVESRLESMAQRYRSLCLRLCLCLSVLSVCFVCLFCLPVLSASLPACLSLSPSLSLSLSVFLSVSLCFSLLAE